jgi:hypothetical protein
MISPATAQTYAQELAEAYRDAELRILERITAAVATGLDAPDYEVQALGRLQLVRAQVIDVLSRMQPLAAAQILADLNAAYLTGVGSAYLDAGRTLDVTLRMSLAQQAAVSALVADTTAGIASAQPGILRSVDDVYRRVVAQASTSVATGSIGRREATQAALNDLLGQGLRAVPTSRGNLALGDYVTMAVRTAVARSAVEGHLGGMDELELDLVTIEPGPRTCDICDKWARLVLARRGAAGVREFRSATDGRLLRIRVDDTLANARAQGWGHPNCRCNIGAYIPGVTRPEDLQRPPWDAKAYEAQQTQRGIERQIRGWKSRQAVAITTEDAAYSRRRVQAYQQAMRDHLSTHSSLKRQSSREQISGTLSG